MKKALLLVAHGSRRPQSNDEIRTLARSLNKRQDHDFDRVDCAFLELAEPSIPDGIAALARQALTHIMVLPYFLSAGRHVYEDIPAEVARAQQAWPDVHVTIAPYIGAAPTMIDLVMAAATRPGYLPDPSGMT